MPSRFLPGRGTPGRGEPHLTPFVEEVLRTGCFSPEDARARTLARELARKLGPFYGRGPYAGFVDGPNTLTLDTALTVVELSRLRDAPDLQGSLLFALMHLLTHFFAAPDRLHQAKYFIADETWALLRHPATAGVMEEIARTYRKLRTSAIFLSQQGADFDSPAGRVLRANAPATLFLQQDPSERAVLQDLFHLSDVEVALFDHVRKHAGWSSAYLRLPGHTGGLIRLVPDAFTRWLVSQEDRERALREQTLPGRPAAISARRCRPWPRAIPTGSREGRMRDPRLVGWLLARASPHPAGAPRLVEQPHPGRAAGPPRGGHGGGTRPDGARQRGWWPKPRGCMPTGCDASRAWWAWVWWRASSGSAKASRAGAPMSWAASCCAGGPPAWWGSPSCRGCSSGRSWFPGRSRGGRVASGLALLVALVMYGLTAGRPYVP